jgi:hypothetical protein
LIKPDNLQYFYDQKEVSSRVFNMHYYMNIAWKFTSYLAVIVFGYACVTTYKQNRDIWDHAARAVQPKKREGGKATLDEHGALKVSIDGEELETSKLSSVDQLLHKAIKFMTTDKVKGQEEYAFYT